MRKFSFLLLTCLLGVFLTSCKNDKVDPITPPSASSHFWIYGGIENGYALLLHTTDGGRTWNRQGDAAQFPPNGFIDGDAMDVNTAMLLAAPDQSGESFYYFTQDKGNSWDKMSFTDNKNKVTQTIENIRRTASLPSSAWPAAWAVGGPDLVKFSNDNRETWNQKYVPNPSPNRSFHIVELNAPDNVWIADAKQVWTTKDKGETWVNHDLFNMWIIFPPNILDNWKYNKISLEGDVVTVLGYTGFPLYYNLVGRSPDKGNTWEKVENHQRSEWENLNNLFTFSETELYIVGKNQPVYYTMDNGTTWESYVFENYENTNLQDVFAVGNEVFVCGTTTSPPGSFLVYYSPDGGNNWENRSPLIQLDNPKDSTSIHFIYCP